MTQRRTLAIALAGAVFLLAGCATQERNEEVPAKSSALTPGGAKLYLKKGQTTQAEVSETFGTPDRVTHQDDVQVWVYDKTSYEYHKESGYFTVLFAGSGGDRVRSSSRSTLLTIYFDQSDRVYTELRFSF